MEYIDMPNKFKTLGGESSPLDVDEKAINNALRNILGTDKGTIPGHPEFGSSVTRYLFEMIDPLVEQMIELEFRYAVDRWEPRVTITNIDIKSDPDYNTLKIVVRYLIKGDIKNKENDFVYIRN